MRQLVFVMITACGGGGANPAEPVQNTAPQKCTVIPEGNYSFGAGPTLDAVMDSFGPTGVPAGTCTTGFDGTLQSITCQQPSPALTLRGTFAAGEGVHLTSDTFSGQLEYSDAVVLLGTLTNAGGENLFVRLELGDCATVDACLAAMQNARKCE